MVKLLGLCLKANRMSAILRWFVINDSWILPDLKTHQMNKTVKIGDTIY